MHTRAPQVVLYNTPLAALYVLNHLSLLRDLFHTVGIPAAVEAEFLATDTQFRQQALADSSWIQVVTLQHWRTVLSFTGLDLGEAEVLAVAIEVDARLVIIDERKGRHDAQRLGLPLTGTLSLLLLCCALFENRRDL